MNAYLINSLGSMTLLRSPINIKKNIDTEARKVSVSSYYDKACATSEILNKDYSPNEVIDKFHNPIGFFKSIV